MESDSDVHANSTLDSLDDACINCVVKHVRSVADLASLQLTCRRQRGVVERCGAVWRALLEAHHRVVAQAPAGRGPPTEALRAAYRQLHALRDRHTIHVTALYTDGGFDAPAPRFWAGNLWVASSRAMACSAAATRNVHVVGAVRPLGTPRDGGGPGRGTLLERCRAPAAQLLRFAATDARTPAQRAEHALQLLTPEGLADLFLALYRSYETGEALGQLLWKGLPPQDAVVQQVHSLAWAIWQHQPSCGELQLRRLPAPAPPSPALHGRAPAAAAAGAAATQLRAEQQQQRQRQQEQEQQQQQQQQRQAAEVAARGERGLHAIDELAVREWESAGDGEDQHIGWIEEVLVDRGVSVTSPLQCGALFVSMQCRPSSSAGAGVSDTTDAPAPSHRETEGLVPLASPGATAAADALRCVAAQPAVAALHDALNRSAVDDAVAAGQLPPVLDSGATASGEWVEFAPPREAQRIAAPHTFWPVVWFRFRSEGEAPAASSGEAAAVVAVAAAPPAQAPPAPQEPGASESVPQQQQLRAGSAADATRVGAAQRLPRQCPDFPKLASSAPEAALAFGWGPGDSERHLLHIGLRAPRAASHVCIKLIAGEDVRPDYNADLGGANIDASSVLLRGRQATLRGVSAV